MLRISSLALAALVAVTGSASAQTLEKFNFALNWFPVGDHAAYWVALEKGYYKAKGLDVTLENSKGSGDVIAKLDTGRADAGVADSAVVIAASTRGSTVKSVGMITTGAANVSVTARPPPASVTSGSVPVCSCSQRNVVGR